MNFSSRFEKNIWAQPDLVKRVFAQPTPSWMRAPHKKKIILVGVGTNYHAAQITSWLWNLAGLTTSAVHSFDFVMGRSPLRRGDWGIFLSHRGSKSYTVQAEKMAREAGARTAILTGEKSPWSGTSCRIETGPMEDTGAFTQSLTTTLAWLMRWPSLPVLLRPFHGLDKNLAWGPRFPNVTPGTDIIFVGDSVREWVAREMALKVQETSYLPARAFGLEEFLHGPQLSTSKHSLVIGFSAPRQKRWNALYHYLKAVRVPFLEVSNGNWLAQILWGQRLTADICRQLGLNPDLLRNDDPRRRAAAEKIKL